MTAAPLHLVLAGISRAEVCGHSRHAAILSDALSAAGAEVSITWLRRRGPDAGANLALARAVERRCASGPVDAVVLHYSAFTFAWRGLPVGVPYLAFRLRRAGVPVVLYAHELALPWGRAGWRGAVQAAAQRAALVPLIAAARSIVVTTDDRRDWLVTRRWLRRRPVHVAPVFANLDLDLARAAESGRSRPAPPAEAADTVRGRIGVFGFRDAAVDIDLAVGAVAAVTRRIPAAHLALIGAPGPDSPEARRWQRQAAGAGCRLALSGVVDEAELCRQLRSCEVLLHLDPAGPTSRRSTLATELALGCPVVALDGPYRGIGLTGAGAVSVVAPATDALAAETTRLLVDPAARRQLGARAGAFAARHLSPRRSAAITLDAVRSALAPRDPRLRVALVGTYGVRDEGGTERACAELIRRSHHDVAFTVVADTLAPDLRPLVHRWVRVPTVRRPFALRFLTYFAGAALALARLDVDLVHAVGAVVPNRVDLASIHFCHAAHRRTTGPAGRRGPRATNRALAHALARTAERWCFRPGRLRRFATVSSGVAGEVTRHYPGIPVSVVPNGVDLHRFSPDDRRRVARRAQLGIAAEVVALFVGGEWDRKGLAIAIEATAKARSGGADVVLWVIGDGDLDRYRRLADDCGVSAAIRFLGWRADTEAFYAAADLFVLPTGYEALSLAMLEAAASGLPLIIPDVSGTHELVDGDNGGGVIVERSVDGVAAALGELALDARHRAALGARARRRAERYTWERSAAATVAIYRELHGSGR